MAGARGKIICLHYSVLTPQPSAITDGSKTKNDRKLVLYAVKSTFFLIAGVRRAQALDLRTYVHLDAEMVPMRYRTPRHAPHQPNTKMFINSMMCSDFGCVTFLSIVHIGHCEHCKKS